MKNKQAGTRRGAAVPSSPSLRQSPVRRRSPAPGSAGSDRTTALAGLGGSAHHSAPASLPSSSLPPQWSAIPAHTHTHRALQLRSAPTSPPRSAERGRAAPARAGTWLRLGRRVTRAGPGRAGGLPRTGAQTRQRCPCRPPQHPRGPGSRWPWQPLRRRWGSGLWALPPPPAVPPRAGERPPRQAGWAASCRARCRPFALVLLSAGSVTRPPPPPPRLGPAPASAPFPAAGKAHRAGRPGLRQHPARPRRPPGPALQGLYLRQGAARGPRPARPGR